MRGRVLPSSGSRHGRFERRCLSVSNQAIVLQWRRPGFLVPVTVALAAAPSGLVSEGGRGCARFGTKAANLRLGPARLDPSIEKGGSQTGVFGRQTSEGGSLRQSQVGLALKAPKSVSSRGGRAAGGWCRSVVRAGKDGGLKGPLASVPSSLSCREFDLGT